MARRLLAGLLLCGVASMSVAACEDRWGYYGGYGHYRPYICDQYTSCGSCTPVAGCGWCSFQGGGICLANPSECGVNAFSWTWEATGCAASNDAGAGPASKDGARPGLPDAAPAAPTSRDASSDQAPDR